MTTQEKVRIIIDGDSTGVKNALSGANTSLTGFGNTLKRMIMAGGAIYLAKQGFDMLVGAIKGAIGFIKESIDAAAEEQLQIAKLNQALESTGQYTDAVSRSLQDYAASLQKSTMYADDAVIGVEAMLATFKLTEEEIKIATEATLNLAAATGQDLQSASILMGKAMVGETGMLKRYGIMVDEAKYKAEGWRAVIDEINVEFGGQAQAQAKTYTGRIEQLKNMFGDAKEMLGNAFIPTITKVVEWFMTGGDAASGMASPMERLSGWVKTATDNMGKWLDLNWENIIGIAEETFRKIEEFITMIKEADYTKIKNGIENIGRAFNFLAGDRDSGIEGANNKYQDFIDKTGELLHAAGTIMAFSRVVYAAFDVMGQSIVWAVMGLQNFAAAISGIAEAFIAAKTGEWEKIPQIIKDTADSIDINLIAATQATDEAFKGLDEAWDSFIKFYNDTNHLTLTDDTAIVKENVARMHTALKQEDWDYNVSIMADTSEAIDNVKKLVELIGGVRGKTVSINVKTEYYGGIEGGEAQTPSYGPNMPTQPKKLHQSGGILGMDEYIPDLGLWGRKGEAWIPSDLVRAIKENRASFAGLGAGGGSITNEFNISQLVVREEADVGRIAKELYNMQQTRSRLS